MRDKARSLFGFGGGDGVPAARAPDEVVEVPREAPRGNPERDRSWDAPTPGDEGVVSWAGMGARERAAACLAALMAGWPMDVSTLSYHARRDVVFAVRKVEDAPDVVATSRPLPLSETLDKLRAILGLDEVAVRRALAMRAEKAGPLLLAVRGRR